MPGFTGMVTDRMKIAVLSGKGGTGKTMVSVNLSAAAKKAFYIDCDVEEPNGYLFFKPTSVVSDKVEIKLPVVDENLCTGCRKCVNFCKFNALAYVGNKLRIFDEICHSCGGCILFCPEKALSVKYKSIGYVQKGVSENVSVMTGILNPGESSGVPIIKKLLKDDIQDSVISFIDCPPGSACVVMESIKDADYCILVAEPSLFGAHNLAMVYDLVKMFGKPHGVILNKCLNGNNPSEEFCLKNGINILEKIPFDNELGFLNSNGLIAVRESEKFKNIFSSLLTKIIKEAQHETALDS